MNSCRTQPTTPNHHLVPFLPSTSLKSGFSMWWPPPLSSSSTWYTSTRFLVLIGQPGTTSDLGTHRGSIPQCVGRRFSFPSCLAPCWRQSDAIFSCHCPRACPLRNCTHHPVHWSHQTGDRASPSRSTFMARNLDYKIAFFGGGASPTRTPTHQHRDVLFFCPL